jgi:site-specific recombinase XerD
MSDPHDPDVESFLLLLAARRSPRTVDAYRRDLASFAATIDHPIGAASTEEIAAWLATMRADGRAPATIARRLAAVRAYLRHPPPQRRRRPPRHPGAPRPRLALDDAEVHAPE